MPDVEMSLKVDASKSLLIMEKLQAVTERPIRITRSADAPIAIDGLESAYGDLLDFLLENRLLGRAKFSEQTIVVEPTPVLESMVGLLNAICDGLEAGAA